MPTILFLGAAYLAVGLVLGVAVSVWEMEPERSLFERLVVLAIITLLWPAKLLGEILEDA